MSYFMNQKSKLFFIYKIGESILYHENTLKKNRRLLCIHEKKNLMTIGYSQREVSLLSIM